MTFDEWVRSLHPSWHRDAACREHPELSWFPTGHESSKRARAVCASCLVRVECAEIGASEAHGVWGGQRASKRERATDVAA